MKNLNIKYHNVDVEKIKNLVEFDTPTVANGLALLGVRDDSYGYTGPDIRALTPDFGARVGIAVTARMDTTSPGVEECDNLYKDWLQGMLDIAKDKDSLPVFAVIESVGLRPRYTVTIGAGALGIPPSVIKRNIEWFGREVLPKFQAPP